MNKFILFLLKSIVNHPDEIVINEIQTDGETTYSLKLNQEDIPLVIGKGGKNIRAIRTLARLKGSILGENVRVQIEEAN